MTDLAVERPCTSRWDWRKASSGGWSAATDRAAGERLFHAYDVNNNAACEISLGLFESVEPPNEGSRFCGVCMDVVRAEPFGREKREYRTEVGVFPPKENR